MKNALPVRGLEAAHELDALCSLGAPIPHKARECNGSQVAHSCLLWGGVLQDLCAQVAAANGAQVLLVGLAVACVLVQHVGVASLNLPFQEAINQDWQVARSPGKIARCSR